MATYSSPYGNPRLPAAPMAVPAARAESDVEVEWITHQDERVRVLYDELWQRVTARKADQAHRITAQFSPALHVANRGLFDEATMHERQTREDGESARATEDAHTARVLARCVAGQNVGIKEVSDKVWLVSFMQ